MKHTLYKEADYKTSEHMGGTARELAVFPATAEYLNRDFICAVVSCTHKRGEFL